MTAEEYLHHRNPGGKHHPSESYDYGVTELNAEYPSATLTYGSSAEDRVTVERLRGGHRILHDGKIVAVVHAGIAYYENPRWKRRIPSRVYDRQDKAHDLGIESYRHVKYLSEVAGLVSQAAKTNLERYPHLLQRIVVRGEPMTIRAEETPRRDRGTTIAILNAEGLLVARASNEWGATLLTVAREYRGKGLGRILGRVWYEHNPSFKSGGFTAAGEQNALALWRDRVHEFSASGWYTALVRAGRMTPGRVKEILAGAAESAPAAGSPPTSRRPCPRRARRSSTRTGTRRSWCTTARSSRSRTSGSSTATASSATPLTWARSSTESITIVRSPI